MLLDMEKNACIWLCGTSRGKCWKQMYLLLPHKHVHVGKAVHFSCIYEVLLDVIDVIGGFYGGSWTEGYVCCIITNCWSISNHRVYHKYHIKKEKDLGVEK